MAECYRFVVTGRVQGVGYRLATADRARTLGLAGWVCNREDGCVEGVARGEPAALAALRAFLERGPADADVRSVTWTEDAGEKLGAGFVVHRRMPA